jgi:MoaA/NifB/PqqE/SkfB family radical SAM enzyme
MIKHPIKKNIERGMKFISSVKNLVLRNTSELLKPKWLWFEVTDKCNCHCKFCNIWQKKPTEHILTPDEIERIFSSELFRGLKHILLSGGEPVIRTDIKEVILAIHRALPKAKIVLGTNGLLADRVLDVVKFAIEQCNIDFTVGVSLDGFQKDHDEARGIKGLFDKVDYLLHNLTLLKAKYGNKLNIAVGFVLTDFTFPSLNKVKLYIKELNIPLSMLNIQWYNESSYYNNIGRKLLHNNKSLDRIIHSQEPSIINEMGLNSLNGKSIKFPCFAMYTFCLLKCNGDIVPCFNFWDFKAGNVRKNTPTEIWHSLQSKKARRFVKDCSGCLNACGVGWSFESCILSFLPLYIKIRKNKVKSN